MYDGKVYNIKESADVLEELCKDHLGLHSLTGCDTVSYPFFKGKQSAFFYPKEVQESWPPYIW